MLFIEGKATHALLYYFSTGWLPCVHSVMFSVQVDNLIYQSRPRAHVSVLFNYNSTVTLYWNTLWNKTDKLQSATPKMVMPHVLLAYTNAVK